jgi:type II restriction enzyme
MALNKGEWSEVYVFLKLLADGKLYAADKDLNKIEEIYYPILKVLKEGTSGDLEFIRNTHIKVIDKDGNILIKLTVEEFKEKSIELLHEIQNSKKSAFDVPNILSFMHSIKITKLKAKSKEKRDITLIVHDLFTGYNPILGFSIKSRLGSASTLINASGSTNFVYRLSIPLDEHTVNEINSIDGNSKIRDRVIEISKRESELEYYGMQNEKFEQNLMMIDSQFPIIISEILKLFYSGQGNRISDLVEKLKELNPCNFNLENNHPYYEYKIKNFLTDSALGMTANTIWTGHYDANGGYIIVKEDGDILCYHIYNRNEFQDYLYDNTKLETPSSSKHGFGEIYNINGTQFFKLNLQVRFI